MWSRRAPKLKVTRNSSWKHDSYQRRRQASQRTEFFVSKQKFGRFGVKLCLKNVVFSNLGGSQSLKKEPFLTNPQFSICFFSSIQVRAFLPRIISWGDGLKSELHPGNWRWIPNMMVYRGTSFSIWRHFWTSKNPCQISEGFWISGKSWVVFWI